MASVFLRSSRIAHVLRATSRAGTLTSRGLSAATSHGSSALNAQPDVVVVGGGCAGIACAVALAESGRGLKVHLVETDCRLGGRARSWEDAVTGHPLHIGPHVVYSDYPNYFRLLKLLGTEKQIVWQRDRDVFVTINGYDAKGSYVSWPIRLWNQLPPPMHWLPAVISDPFVRFRDACTLIPFTAFILQLSDRNLLHQNRKTDLETWKRLDQMTGQELLDKFGVSKAYQDHVMAFCSNAILNVPLNEVSGASLVSFFRRMIGRPNVALGFVDGGLGTVLEPAKGFLEEKSDGRCVVSLNTRVRKVGLTGSRVDSVEMVQEPSDGSPETVSVLRPKYGVVMTLPALETLDLLPDRVKQLPSCNLVSASGQQADSVSAVLSRFRPCRYFSLYLWFDRDVHLGATGGSDGVLSGHQFWAKRYHPSDLCCEFYDFTKIYTKDGPAGFVAEETRSAIGVNMIDVDRLEDGTQRRPLTDEELVAKALEELVESVPSAGEARLLRSVVHRVPMAIPRPVTGTEMSRPFPGLASKEAEGLYFAGDWTQTQFPACMETAVQSGFACADDILDRLDAGEGMESIPRQKWAESQPSISESARIPSKLLWWPLLRTLCGLGRVA